MLSHKIISSNLIRNRYYVGHYKIDDLLHKSDVLSLLMYGKAYVIIHNSYTLINTIINVVIIINILSTN